MTKKKWILMAEDDNNDAELIERMLAMCSAIVVSVWVARYLGPREFGVLSYAVAFVALFTPLAALGINNILVKELVMDRERERVLLGSALIARFLGTAAAIAICVATIYYVQGAEQARVLFPDAVGVFVLPPSRETLLERLETRFEHGGNVHRVSSPRKRDAY